MFSPDWQAPLSTADQPATGPSNQGCKSNQECCRKSMRLLVFLSSCPVHVEHYLLFLFLILSIFLVLLLPVEFCCAVLLAPTLHDGERQFNRLFSPLPISFICLTQFFNFFPFQLSNNGPIDGLYNFKFRSIYACLVSLQSHPHKLLVNFLCDIYCQTLSLYV